MLRSLTRHVLHKSSQLGMVTSCSCEPPKMWFTTMFRDEMSSKNDPYLRFVENNPTTINRLPKLGSEGQNHRTSSNVGKEIRQDNNFLIGQKITRKEKMSLLMKTLYDLEDSRDAIYGTLDAWVAWEQNFPIAALKNVLMALEKDQQWHRIVQVIKWMLSKGQGNTMGTYQQLIRALDMDHRAEEAHSFWMKKIGNDYHSVPWQACHLMISVYHRNNMLDRLVKLFRSLEAFDRKPPEKSIVQKVADAYELLGLVDEKEKLLEKYANLMRKTRAEPKEKSTTVKSNKKEGSSGHSRDRSSAHAYW